MTNTLFRYLPVGYNGKRVTQTNNCGNVCLNLDLPYTFELKRIFFFHDEVFGPLASDANLIYRGTSVLTIPSYVSPWTHP